MKKTILSFMTVALTAFASSAEIAEVDFTKTNDMFGLERQSFTGNATVQTTTPVREVIYTQDHVKYSFTCGEKTGENGGWALVNANTSQPTSNGLKNTGMMALNNMSMTGNPTAYSTEPIITITVPGGKVTKVDLWFANNGITGLSTVTFGGKSASYTQDTSRGYRFDLKYSWSDANAELNNEVVWTATSLLQAMVYLQYVEVTYELDQGDLADPELSFSSDEVEVIKKYGDIVNVPTLNNPYNLPVTWTSSDENVATVDETGEVTLENRGKTRITASFEGNDEYAAKSVSYILNVINSANNIQELLTYAPASGDRVYVNFPMTVNYYNNSSGAEYVTDMYGTGALVRAEEISTNGSESEAKPISYSVGDIIPQGWIATNSPESQIAPVRWVGTPAKSTETAEVTYPIVSTVTGADAFKVVIIKGLTVETSQPDDKPYYGTTTEGNSLQIRNSFGVAVPVGTWDVTCIPSSTSSMFYIMPISYTEPAKLQFPEEFEVSVDSETVVVDKYIDKEIDAYTIELSGTTTNETVTLTFEIPEGWDGIIGTQQEHAAMSLKKRVNASNFIDIESFKQYFPDPEQGSEFTYATDANIVGTYFLYSGDQVDMANPIQVVSHVQKVEPDPEFPAEFDVTINDEGLEVTKGFEQDIYTVKISGMTNAETVTVTLEVPEGWDGFLGATQADMIGGGAEPLKKVATVAEDDDELWAPVAALKESMNLKETNSLTFDVNGEEQMGKFFLYKGEKAYAMPIDIEVNVEKAPEPGTPCTVDVNMGGISTSQSAKVGEEFSVKFGLDEYWEVSSLTVNGKDALESEGWEDNKYTTTIATDLVINAGVEYTGELNETLTGVGEATLGNGVKISVADGELLITDMTVGDEICIYNLSGQVISSSKAVETAAKYKLTRNIVYIVRVGNVAAKVIL